MNQPLVMPHALVNQQQHIAPTVSSRARVRVSQFVIRDTVKTRTCFPIQIQTILLCLLLASGCAQRIPASPLQPAQILPPLQLPTAPVVTDFPTLSLPAATFQQLDNGIRIGAFASARAPYVQMQLQVDAGRMLYGDAVDLLAEMLRLVGNADSEAAWQQHWRSLGASLSVRSGNHRLIFSAEVLPQHADALLDTLLALWQQPTLALPASQAEARRNLRARQREADLQGGDAERLWQRLAYGESHPYGQAAASASSLGKIDTAQLQATWQQARTEAQQWLFAGAFSPADLARWQHKLAAQAPVRPSARWRNEQHPLPPPASDWQLHVLDTPGAAHVQLQLGFALPLAQPEQRWQCEAVAALLGNNSGRLFRDLRERRGMSYDPGADCSAAPLASAFRLTASTRPEHTAAMLHGLRDHLRQLRDGDISDAELALLRRSLRGGLRMQLETARQRSSRFHLEEWLGGDWQDLVAKDRYWQQLAAPSLQQFAADWLTSEPITVIRGDADELIPQLRRLLPDARVIRHDGLD